MGVGEAVTSFLERKGAPGIVERTLIRPPSSQLGPLADGERRAVMTESPLALKYDAAKDRESAYEILRARSDAAASEAEAAEQAAEEATAAVREFQAARRYSGPRVSRSTSRPARRDTTLSDALTSAVIKELRGTTGRRIVRGILGGFFKGR